MSDAMLLHVNKERPAGRTRDTVEVQPYRE
jgi:hypothetical protein